MDIVERARVFATAAHAAVGQVRRYTGEPYSVHPRAVAELVASVDHTPEMIAAAWLHDVVEDTRVMIEQIRDEFGQGVADLVWWLTDRSRPEDGNRAARKAIDRMHLSQAPTAAHTVKIADLIDNTLTITAHDPHFAKPYRREKLLLLDAMPNGNVALMKIARRQIEELR